MTTAGPDLAKGVRETVVVVVLMAALAMACAAGTALLPPERAAETQEARP